MMRSVTVFLVALGACSQGDATSTAAELIRKGDPKACMHPEVRDFIIETIKDVPAPNLPVEDVEAGRKSAKDPELSTFQAIKSDADTGQVTCAVNVKLIYLPQDAIFDPEKDTETSTVEYTLRQSLEDPNDFIMTTGSFAVLRNRWSHIWGGAALRHQMDKILENSSLPAGQ